MYNVIVWKTNGNEDIRVFKKNQHLVKSIH
jgi:hypothetical protein